jgi:hypothetical protein
VFERFTDRARRVVVLAQEEGRMARAHAISTDFLLLALLREGEGVAAVVLTKLGVDEPKLRELVGKVHEGEASTEWGHIPFTIRTKKVLELSLREALQLGHNYIGTEHLLLGLVRTETTAKSGLVGPLLADLGIELPAVRQEVLVILNGYREAERRASAPLTPGVTMVVAGGSGASGPRVGDFTFSPTGTPHEPPPKVPESFTEILDETCAGYVWQDKLLRYWKWAFSGWSIYDEKSRKWIPSSQYPQTDGGWERVAPAEWTP